MIYCTIFRFPLNDRWIITVYSLVILTGTFTIVTVSLHVLVVLSTNSVCYVCVTYYLLIDWQRV